jgi:hypothetical protein
MRHGDQRTVVIITPSFADSGANIAGGNPVTLRVFGEAGEAIRTNGLTYDYASGHIWITPLALPLEGGVISVGGALQPNSFPKIKFGSANAHWVDLQWPNNTVGAPASPAGVLPVWVNNAWVNSATGQGFILYGNRPAAPTITGSHAANGAIVVEFDQPVPEHADLSAIEYRINGASNWLIADGTSSPITISGLTNGQSYIIELRARNLFGTSAATGPIVETPLDCHISSMTPTVVEVQAVGGSGTLHISGSAADCSWVASSSEAWILFTDGGSASGFKSGVEFVAAPNDTGALRVAVIRVGDATATVVQHPNRCSGDLDGNGQVDGGDVGLLLLQWGPC